MIDINAINNMIDLRDLGLKCDEDIFDIMFKYINTENKIYFYIWDSTNEVDLIYCIYREK